MPPPAEEEKEEASGPSPIVRSGDQEKEHVDDDDDEGPTPNACLLDAAARGDLALVRRLIGGDGDGGDGGASSSSTPCANPDCARAEDGATPLMLAAQNGHADVVAALLSAGAAWNLLDFGGHCAGEHAGSREVAATIMQFAVEMEELLIERGEEEEGGDEEEEEGEERESREYLSSRLTYDDAAPSGPRLLDANGDAVMMGWETPIMERHADELLLGGGGSRRGPEPPATATAAAKSVLNVGFGLGIIDRELRHHQRHGQSAPPRRHVIVEAHPDVLARIDAEGWPQMQGVTVLRGRWEDVLAPGSPAMTRGKEEGGIADVLATGGFDAIYWDTYAQHARQLRRFHGDVLPRLLRRPRRQQRGGARGGEAEGDADENDDDDNDDEGGRYAWFNGVGSDNVFFHAVSTQVIARHLATKGFRTAFSKVAVAELGDATWQGVAREYWRLPVYLMPLVRWEKREG